jgi:acyl-CoA thioesterase FadM
MGHVNNTIYVRWFDEALDEAVAAAGLPLADPGRPGLRLEGTHYVVNYLRSAMAGDTLEISSRVTGTAGDHLEWTQEIRCAGDDAVMIRAVSQQRPLGLAEAGLTGEAVLAALTQPAG